MDHSSHSFILIWLIICFMSMVNCYTNSLSPAQYNRGYQTTYSSGQSSKSYKENASSNWKSLKKEELEDLIKKMKAKVQISRNIIDSLNIAIKSNDAYLLADEEIRLKINALIDKMSKTDVTHIAEAQALVDAYIDSTIPYDELNLLKTTIDLLYKKFCEQVIQIVAIYNGNLTPIDKAARIEAIWNQAKLYATQMLNNIPKFQAKTDEILVICTLCSKKYAITEAKALTNLNPNLIPDNNPFSSLTYVSPETAKDLLGLLPLDHLMTALYNIVEVTYLSRQCQTEIETAISPFDFITYASEKQSSTPLPELFIELSAQEIIICAMNIQALVPKLSKFTYEIIFYAESIQANSIKTVQALLKIKELSQNSILA